MKVLQIINSLGTGGAEKLLLDSIPLYRKAGIEMDLLLLWDNDFQFYRQLKELNCCKIYVLKKSDNLKDVYRLSHILKIIKIIRNYDLIHVHLFPALYFTAVANIGIGKKLIFTEHNTSNRRIANPIFKFFEKWCYARYSKLVYITEEIRDIYQNYLKLNQESIVISNGVDLDKIKNTVPYIKSEIASNIKKDDILLLQVSSFRHSKDQDTVIRSMMSLPENVKLLLAGDGERRAELEKLTKENQLEERVYFLGQRMDIPQLLKSVDFIVLSSNYEGQPLSAIEGLVSGKVFIGSDVAGLKELTKGVGLSFPQGDEKSLARLISDLISHPDKQQAFIEKGIKIATKYDIHQMVEKYMNLYKSLYSGK